MRFVDYVSIEVVAGKGGDGIISFRREAHVDKGGPDGGDGGWGGSIYFVGDSGMNTLLPFYQTKKIFGYNGENGRPKRQTGANGKDIFIKVPLGTQVFLKKSLICDIILEKKYLIAKGGRGGLGNFHFRNSKNKAPRISENGELGQNFYLDLQLKVMADIGLVGKPNAGKSTLLSLISNSKPKIANYEFTTLVPQLGVVKIYENSFVTADLPGLIQGASSGKGMGIIFLKHIERCRAIVHVIDFGSDNKNPIKDFIEIKSELEKFNKKLLDLNQIVIANKCDLPNFQFNLANFKRKFPKIKIIKSSLISAKQNEINIIKEKMFGLLGENQKKLEIQEINTSKIEFNLKAPFLIKSRNNGFFEITGELIQKIIQKIPLNSQENILRFNAKVKKIGLWDELIKKGIKPGDLVRIYEFEFHWN
ncbi:GTPase ObgE [Mycoplasma hyopneumoniae]|uniref:GTPase Obg n=1 Tax=Mesomycoplasma hyopneumoniae (strain 7448) TaxID=262722 RepID=OBG_MESH7|nr:GTPase ObgE [Mesomycoplasma hyopneumoniae]Q4A8X1.1 RecName: Full=GTPase Obg; AltName: Full=GTP-binding protein Obg [Mesomycoplasma hyopneumoniae 7448]AAZ53418.1 GTP-binding protein Obg [Mesomycoplasma hyopneumoniae 7448]MXR10803.1 GTPase ObgE [Mesomycoplasma hyopneumoniae]MXR34166.1 GTPase ObgE [Mesomycoplasma hyopneumoniae]MXR34804.1 GTPase ObgE [Mesomycoplasma hyopneumoniae]MXR63714.1 GTPase ObgE [Mesomycoplasma hyopneumoniae]